jgi:hypothetical protein
MRVRLNLQQKILFLVAVSMSLILRDTILFSRIA